MLSLGSLSKSDASKLYAGVASTFDTSETITTSSSKSCECPRSSPDLNGLNGDEISRKCSWYDESGVLRDDWSTRGPFPLATSGINDCRYSSSLT